MQTTAKLPETENATEIPTGRVRVAGGVLHRLSDYHATTLAHTQVRFRETAMLAKIRRLLPEQRTELNHIIDGMISTQEKKERNEGFVDAIARLSEESFSRIWDNPKDAEYDNL